MPHALDMHAEQVYVAGGNVSALSGDVGEVVSAFLTALDNAAGAVAYLPDTGFSDPKLVSIGTQVEGAVDDYRAELCSPAQQLVDEVSGLGNSTQESANVVVCADDEASAQVAPASEDSLDFRSIIADRIHAEPASASEPRPS